MTRFHAETVDLMTSSWLIALLCDGSRPGPYLMDLNTLLAAMQAFGNLSLAQHTDRLENWWVG